MLKTFCLKYFCCTKNNNFNSNNDDTSIDSCDSSNSLYIEKNIITKNIIIEKTTETRPKKSDSLETISLHDNLVSGYEIDLINTKLSLNISKSKVHNDNLITGKIYVFVLPTCLAKIYIGQLVMQIDKTCIFNVSNFYSRKKQKILQSKISERKYDITDEFVFYQNNVQNNMLNIFGV